MNIDVEGQYG